MMKELMQFLTEQGCTNIVTGGDEFHWWIEFITPNALQGMVMRVRDGRLIEGIEHRGELTIHDSFDDFKEAWLEGYAPISPEEQMYWESVEARLLAEDQAKLDQGLVKCGCGSWAKPGSTHYPGADPENGPAHITY